MVVLQYKKWLCENYAVSSVNSMLAALNQFLEFLGGSRLKVKRLKYQKQMILSSDREITKQEYERLIRAAQNKKSARLLIGMQTLAMTGARVSELSFFTVEAAKRGAVETFNKGKSRVILIPESLKKRLLYYASRQGITRGHIFVTGSGKIMDRSNFWKEMNALQADAKVNGKKIFPHNLRHLFARTFYKKTKDLAGLADLLGHSHLDITRIYTATTGEIYKNQIEHLGLLHVETNQ